MKVCFGERYQDQPPYDSRVHSVPYFSKYVPFFFYSKKNAKATSSSLKYTNVPGTSFWHTKKLFYSYFSAFSSLLGAIGPDTSCECKLSSQVRKLEEL